MDFYTRSETALLVVVPLQEALPEEVEEHLEETILQVGQFLTIPLKFLQNLLVEVLHLPVQVLNDRVHPRFFALDTDTDRTHILETSGRDEKHELDHLAIFEVKQVAPFDGDDDLVIDELGFEAFEVGQLHPFEIRRILLPLPAEPVLTDCLFYGPLLYRLLSLGIAVLLGIPTRILLVLLSFRCLSNVQFKIFLFLLLSMVDLNLLPRLLLWFRFHIKTIRNLYDFPIFLPLDVRRSRWVQLQLQVDLRQMQVILHKKSIPNGLLLFLLDERMLQELSPPHPLLRVHLQSPKKKIIGIRRDSDPVEGQLLVRTEISLLLNLPQTLPRTHRVVKHNPEHHLKENDTDRPNISLNIVKSTFKP